MTESKPARPPQVTLAGWLVMAGSVVVVLMAFSQVAGLRSLETRESIEEYLSKPPGDSLGLGVQGVLSLLRIAYMVAAACAAATAILGWQVLQRSRGARVALSVLVVPLFLTGLASGGIASAVVSAAILMLWFQPARDWFDGIARAPASRPVAPTWPPEPPSRDPLLDLPPPTAPPLYPEPHAVDAAPREVPSARPASVTWACVLTWTFTAAAFALFAVVLVVMIAAPHAFIDEAHRQNPDLAGDGLSDGALRTAALVASGLVVAWSAAAGALAVLTWHRVRWAAVGLMGSTGLAGAMCLLGIVGSLALLVPLAGCAATVALLLRAESRLWFRS